MVSDNEFYASFRDSVIGPDPDPGDLTNKSHGVSFLMHHYDMIPLRNRDFFWNMTRIKKIQKSEGVHPEFSILSGCNRFFWK